MTDAYLKKLTPIEHHGGYLVKRDDLYSFAGARGAKVRGCRILAQRHKKAGKVGLVTAGSRQSPQAVIVALLAQRLGLACRIHTPQGQLTPELLAAKAAGAELIQWYPGYNSNIAYRARVDARERGWGEIPFGMECPEAVQQAAAQVANLPFGEFTRIVIPVGSGINLAGVLRGLDERDQDVPVLGVRVGIDPTKILDVYAPCGWRTMVTLEKSPLAYHTPATSTSLLGSLQLDPIYEAKAVPYLQPGDLFWAVGIRPTLAP